MIYKKYIKNNLPKNFICQKLNYKYDKFYERDCGYVNFGE